MPSFDPIALDRLAAVTGGCQPRYAMNSAGMNFGGGFRYAFRFGAQQQQQQQVQQAAAAPPPRERGPRDVLVQTASGPGAQPPGDFA